MSDARGALGQARDAVRTARETGSRDLDRQLALMRVADALDRLAVADDNLRQEQAGPGNAVEAAAALDAARAEIDDAIALGRTALEPALRQALERLAEAADDAVAGVLGRNRSPRSGTAAAQAPQLASPAGTDAPPAVDRGTGEAPSADREAVPESPPVRFGAAAPSEAAPGAPFAVQFVAYPEGAVDAARALLTDAQPGGRIVTEAGGEPLAIGTRVEVALSGEHLIVEGRPRDVQSFRWTGRATLLGFEAALAPEAVATVLRLDIAVDGIVLAKIRLPLGASARPDPTPRHSEQVGFAKTAFASYSSRDRVRVLDRVAAIRIALGIDVFLDCHDLHPGEAWRPNLERAIDHSDSFLLFWSEAAAQSKWVKWEWKRALATLGLDGMQFHPLENGVKPPGALASIHLGDPYMDLRAAERLRRTGAPTPETTT